MRPRVGMIGCGLVWCDLHVNECGCLGVYIRRRIARQVGSPNHLSHATDFNQINK